jgi:hypothetical protein
MCCGLAPFREVENAKLAICLCIAAAGLRGSVVYDASASFTGTRFVGPAGGLIDGGGAAYDDLMLSWSIAALPNATYQYTYAMASGAVDDREGPRVNRVIFESDDCNALGRDTATCIHNAAIDGAPAFAVYGAWAGRANVGLPNTIDGLEFVRLPAPTSQIIVVSFNSPNAPVWGDFYLTGGKQYVFNLGNLDHSDPNSMDFIATPGDLSPTPEPSTLLLAGAALTALGLMRRGRRGS